MASASDLTRKGASDSDIDDDSVPTPPKRTCVSNVDDDVKDKKEKMIQSLKENPASVLTLSKMLSCDACKSLARAPIRYCELCHKICSICYTKKGQKCPAEGCKEKLLRKAVVNAELTETIRVMKLPVQCSNRKNGCPEKGEEKEVEEHEIECEFRFVNTKFVVAGLEDRMFKDLLCFVDKGMKERDGKWALFDKRVDGKSYNKAHRDSIEPGGHRFRIILTASDSSFLKGCVTVFGGERVAKKYRVELRLNSCEKEFTITHHGPVFSVDVKEPLNREETYMVAKKKLQVFNKGCDYFGDHNKDKNGETIVPIMVKIIKKELDIPKEDSGTQ